MWNVNQLAWDDRIAHISVVDSGHHNNMRRNGIGLCAQTLDIIMLGSFVDITGRLCVITKREKRIFSFTS